MHSIYTGINLGLIFCRKDNTSKMCINNNFVLYSNEQFTIAEITALPTNIQEINWIVLLIVIMDKHEVKKVFKNCITSVVMYSISNNMLLSV